MKGSLRCNLMVLTCLFTFTVVKGQVMTSEGGQIHVSPGGILHCNGGITLNGSTTLTNDGELVATKNSALPQPGNFRIQGTSAVNGNGNYRVEQDWINNATFIAQNSTVFLYGNTEQFVTSDNGTATTFHNLTLTGTGAAQDRRKTLVNVNGLTDNSGILELTNRELYTGEQTFAVLNPSLTAVQHDNTFNAEGFVSSLGSGYFIRKTNTTNTYLFPVGSSEGVLRYRPVEIDPVNSNENDFAVRFNNYSPNNDGFLLNQKEPEIEDANSLFYHSIERIGGNSAADYRIFYLPNLDGEWAGIANWENLQSLWLAINETSQAVAGNFSVQQKSGWDFGSNDYPYVLITTAFGLVIPNVFTPNGDGANDVYFVTAKGLSDFNLVIVNRWGNVMFETDNPNIGWDGTSNGQKCAEGTYFYLLNAKAGDKDIKEHGFLTLIGSN
jgi:gliding motility-associated-like protein